PDVPLDIPEQHVRTTILLHDQRRPFFLNRRVAQIQKCGHRADRGCLYWIIDVLAKHDFLNHLPLETRDREHPVRLGAETLHDALHRAAVAASRPPYLELSMPER